MDYIAGTFLTISIIIIISLFKKDIITFISNLGRVLGLSSKAQIRAKKLEILLADLSILWNHNSAIISLEELAKSSWLSDIKTEPEKVFNFLDAEIIYYWQNTLINMNISKASKVVIGNILEYLDKFGGCPSVVSDKFNNTYQKHIEKEVGLSTYDILANITLTTHSINVAKGLETDEFMKYKETGEKLIIASLAHDLGKIQGNNDKKNYMTGEHPASSVMILETEIEGYDKLKSKEEINYIIINHHKETGDDKQLAKIFRSMDASARRYEVMQFIRDRIAKKDNKIIDNSNVTVPNETKVMPLNVQPVLPSLPPLPLVSINQEKEIEPKSVPNFIKNDTPKTKTDNPLFRDMTESNKPEIIELGWFDLDKFLNTVNREINKIDKGWFKAITVNGDMVLLMTSYAWQLLKMQARDAGVADIADISNNDMDNSTKKSVLMSFVQLLWDKNYVHENWIKKGYYNANFLLTDGSGNDVSGGNGWFIPVRIEAFTNYNTYDDYESRKNGKLKEIVSAKVPPKKATAL